MKIQVGIDFDGVLAYNPFRILRAPVTFIKRKFLGETRTKFYIPESEVEKIIWTILHESSVFPALGTELLRDAVESGSVEAHLVTARFSFLQKNLYAWLNRHHMTHLFSSITINDKDEQPHMYKARVIAERKFDYFIEDNFDIVSHLVTQKNKTKVMWIYNILDRGKPYQYKYPYLEKALQQIVVSSKIEISRSK